MQDDRITLERVMPGRNHPHQLPEEVWKAVKYALLSTFEDNYIWVEIGYKHLRHFDPKWKEFESDSWLRLLDHLYDLKPRYTLLDLVEDLESMAQGPVAQTLHKAVLGDNASIRVPLPPLTDMVVLTPNEEETNHLVELLGYTMERVGKLTFPFIQLDGITLCVFNIQKIPRPTNLSSSFEKLFPNLRYVLSIGKASDRTFSLTISFFLSLSLLSACHLI